MTPDCFLWAPNGLWLISSDDNGRQRSSYCGKPTRAKAEAVAKELCMHIFETSSGRGDKHVVAPLPGRV